MIGGGGGGGGGWGDGSADHEVGGSGAGGVGRSHDAGLIAVVCTDGAHAGSDELHARG